MENLLDKDPTRGLLTTLHRAGDPRVTGKPNADQDQPGVLDRDGSFLRAPFPAGWPGRAERAVDGVSLLDGVSLFEPPARKD
jgi:hypothetical protein